MLPKLISNFNHYIDRAIERNLYVKSYYNQQVLGFSVTRYPSQGNSCIVFQLKSNHLQQRKSFSIIKKRVRLSSTLCYVQQSITKLLQGGNSLCKKSFTLFLILLPASYISTLPLRHLQGQEDKGFSKSYLYTLTCQIIVQDHLIVQVADFSEINKRVGLNKTIALSI